MTKGQLGLQMIRRVKAHGLPFEVVGCETLYGRDAPFRVDLAAEDLLSIADVSEDTLVYVEEPVVGVPETPPAKQGRPFSQPQVLHDVRPVAVGAPVTHPDLVWPPIEIRHTARGVLIDECTARRVWTITPARQVREEWLFIRREGEDTFSFSLSHAPVDTPPVQLALWRAQRYFAERIFQDAKSEAGWDELVIRKYRAWVHHTALDALAVWFVAETKLDWAQAYPRDPELAEQLEVELLPALSMTNVREMRKAVLPLKQLSPEQATHLVVKHLVHRSRSTRSRLKARHQIRGPT